MTFFELRKRRGIKNKKVKPDYWTENFIILLEVLSQTDNGINGPKETDTSIQKKISVVPRGSTFIIAICEIFALVFFVTNVY